MSKLVMPRFENEAEEAQWWYDHRMELADDMIEAAKAGKLGEGTRARYSRRLKEQEEQNSTPQTQPKTAA
jgi:hypothetical protein